MPESRLPYSRHTVSEEDITEVSLVLRGDWLTSGPSVERFESALATKTGAKHAIACASGTAALHLAMLALGLGPRDAVVVPTMTFLATANAVRLAGAEVFFADVDSDTGLLTPESFVQALSRVPADLRPKAVIPVHLRGLPCDMPAIAGIASHHGLAIIEDAAHALGSQYGAGNGSISVGGCASSLMACFSFHPGKIIAMGEGGAVTTNEPDLAARLRSLRSHGMIKDPQQWINPDLGFGSDGPNPWYYEMHAPGYNYRVSDIQCALGVSQLRKLNDFIVRRAALAARYDTAFEKLVPIVRPHVSLSDASPAWHLYSALIDFPAAGISRAGLMRGLRAAGIATQVHYFPVHLQPYYRKRYGDLRLEGSEHYYARTLSLPLYPSLRDEDIDRIVAELSRALECRN